MKKYFIYIVSFMIVAYLASCVFVKKQSSYKYSGIYRIDENGQEVYFYNDKSSVKKINPQAIIEIRDFEVVKKKKDKYGQKILYLKLNDEKSKVFEDFTRNNIKNEVVFIIADEVIMAPVIQETISGGEINLYGIDENQIDKVVRHFKSIK